MSASGSSLLDLGIREIGAGFRRGSWSPVEVANLALQRIEATESSIHAWVFVDPERAIAGALTAERELRAGTDRGPLHGIPIGIKDIFDVAGWVTRCGSEARADAGPASRNASSVEASIEGGAVLLGKTVTQEFAAGTISPPARNPWDPDRIPGGSSGGSAAAVAVGACLAALGSDTGGSIRIPAAACGVSGFKPTFGRLDVSGVFPLSWSLDTVGPIARTVDDTWLMWRALSAGCLTAITDQPLSASANLRDIRIGVSRPFFFDAIQPEVRSVVDAAIAGLREGGATVVETPWPEAAAARACSFLINRIETAALHERVAIDDPDRFARYGPDLRLRIAAGRTLPAATYLKATRARTVLKDSMAALFDRHQLDALLTPTLPTTALMADDLVIEQTGLDESVGVAWTRLTMPFNATGQPVLAIPCGLASDGMPVGLQLVGQPGNESELFEIGAGVERVLGFHASRPPLLAGVNGTNQPRVFE